VNQTSLRRRLFAGAAGLMLGTAATFAFAVPAQAQATQGEEEVAPPTVEFVDDCEGTTVTFGSGSDLVWSVTAGETAVFPGEDGAQPAPDQTASVTVPNDAGEIVVDFEGSPEDDEFPAAHTWVAPAESCEEEPPPNGGLPEEVDADFVTIVTCEFLVFIFRNNGEEDGLSFSLTPNQAAVAGDAPDFVPLLDAEPNEEGFIEIPDGVGLEDADAVGANETIGPLGPLAVDDALAHGFEGAAGLEVTVEVTVGEEPVELDEPVTSFNEAVEGLGCDLEEDGEGGELPVTGNTTMFIAGGAVALLVLGGALFLIARRRRVTFTA
jgi:LPXTG-motif cell wall-anchored protein